MHPDLIKLWTELTSSGSFFILFLLFLFDTHNISHLTYHTQQPNTFRDDRVCKTWSIL